MRLHSLAPWRRVTMHGRRGGRFGSQGTMGRILRCKPYHNARGRHDPGLLRSGHDQKSRCPGWASDPQLRQKLLDDAIPDPDAGLDWAGHPQRLWNAVNSWYFVGVSTGEQVPAYNCYPDVPATVLQRTLIERARR